MPLISINYAFHRHEKLKLLELMHYMHKNPQGINLKPVFRGLLSIGFSWGIFAHLTRLDQSRASENI